MAIGEIITAARYNNLQSKVSSVLGIGSGQYGYGQGLSSVTLIPTNIVNATHMQALKTDLTKLYVHQTGSLTTLTDVAKQDDITDAVYAEYENLATQVFANKNLIYAATQATVENKLTNSRSTSWGGNLQPQSVQHTFTVTFANADARRNFFNAGSEIRFSASLTGGSGSKYTDWHNMLAAIGTVKFSSNLVSGDSGSGSSIGNYSLNSTPQTIFTKFGSGVYSNNEYYIQASGDQASNIITFTVIFNDGSVGATDEPVTGLLTSSISQLRATGSYVSVPSPAFATTINLG